MVTVGRRIRGTIPDPVWQSSRVHRCPTTPKAVGPTLLRSGDVTEAPSSLAGDPEITAMLDTGNRSESNACSGGEGEIAGGEVKPIQGIPAQAGAGV